MTVLDGNIPISLQKWRRRFVRRADLFVLFLTVREKQPQLPFCASEPI